MENIDNFFIWTGDYHPNPSTVQTEHVIYITVPEPEEEELECGLQDENIYPEVDDDKMTEQNLNSCDEESRNLLVNKANNGGANNQQSIVLESNSLDGAQNINVVNVVDMEDVTIRTDKNPRKRAVELEDPQKIKPLHKKIRMRMERGEIPTCVCVICNEKFYTPQLLCYHKSKMHGEGGPIAPKVPKKKTRGSFPCDQCEEIFEYQSQLGVHKGKIHPLPKPPLKVYCCTYCSKTFRKKSNFQQHAETHVKDKTHVCSVCQLSLSTERGLKKHQKTHVNDRVRNYLCDKCGMMFYTNDSLSYHMASHTDESIQKCEICFQELCNKTEFFRHMRHHRGAYLLHCDKCGYGCNHKYQLTRHLKNHGKKVKRKPFKPRDSHNCPENCTCKLPLLRLNRKKKGCLTVNAKRETENATPEIVDAPQEKDITNHTIIALMGCLDAHPIVLLLHRNVRTPLLSSVEHSWIKCRSNLQANLQDAVMFLKKPVEILQVEGNDANFLAKQGRQIVLNKKPEWSVSHNVRAGDSTWPEEIQDKIISLISPHVDNLLLDPQYIATSIVQKELNGDRIRPNVGKMYKTTICHLCDKNLKYRGMLMDHLCTHKSSAMNKLKVLCVDTGLKEPVYSLEDFGNNVYQVTVVVGDQKFTDSSGSEDRAYVGVTCLAYLQLAGMDLKLKQKRMKKP